MSAWRLPSGEPPPPELRRFARETRPHRDEVERLRRRLPLHEGPIHAARPTLLGRLSSPSAGPWRAWLLLPAVGALAALALALRPAAAPTALPAGPSTVAVSDDVRLDVDGLGEVSGPGRAPRVAWQRGLLRASVTPHQGIDLRVQTPEAEVRVVGTVFSVDRGPLGTRVEVERGRVEVRCVGGDARFVEPGEIVDCAPTTAAGNLGRARALQHAGAPLDEVLAATAAGQAMDATDAVRAELRWVGVEVLRQRGQPEAAVAAARAALELGGGHRSADLAAVVAGP
jgi:ferric-dicitrate binding protein FerR (iron transport regulator)